MNIKMRKSWQYMLIALTLVIFAAVSVARRDTKGRVRFSKRPLKPKGKYSRAFQAGEKLRCAMPIRDLENMGVRYKLVETKAGFIIAVFEADDLVSRTLVNEGEWDGDRPQKYLDASRARLARLGNTVECSSPPCHGEAFLDIGANIGYWSFFMASKGLHAVAVEGSPDGVALMKLTKCITPEFDGMVQIVETFVADSDSHCIMMSHGRNIGDSVMHCKEDKKPWSDVELEERRKLLDGSKVYRAEKRRLEEIYNEVWKDPGSKLPFSITATKIDIEGSEAPALMSGESLLATSHTFPTMYIEVMNRVNVLSPEAFLTYLRGHGYLLHEADCTTPINAEDTQAFLTKLNSQPFADIFVSKA